MSVGKSRERNFERETKRKAGRGVLLFEIGGPRFESPETWDTVIGLRLRPVAAAFAIAPTRPWDRRDG